MFIAEIDKMSLYEDQKCRAVNTLLRGLVSLLGSCASQGPTNSCAQSSGQEKRFLLSHRQSRKHSFGYCSLAQCSHFSSAKISSISSLQLYFWSISFSKGEPGLCASLGLVELGLPSLNYHSTKAPRFCLLEGKPEWEEAFQLVLHMKFFIEMLLKEAFNNRHKYSWSLKHQVCF